MIIQQMVDMMLYKLRKTTHKFEVEIVHLRNPKSRIEENVFSCITLFQTIYKETE